jgi:hypothetical protein
LYSIGFVGATLPLDHPGLTRSRRPRPVPVGSGLAGGLLAVRAGDLVVVDGADGVDLLVPGGVGRLGDGDLVAWCTVCQRPVYLLLDLLAQVVDRGVTGDDALSQGGIASSSAVVARCIKAHTSRLPWRRAAR